MNYQFLFFFFATCVFMAINCNFMEIAHSSHTKNQFNFYSQEYQFDAQSCDPLKSAVSVDDTLHQKCFEWLKWAIRVTRFLFLGCRKYQSGDKSCWCQAAIHSITLIGALLSSRHDLNWDIFPKIIVDQRVMFEPLILAHRPPEHHNGPLLYSYTSTDF